MVGKKETRRFPAELDLLEQLDGRPMVYCVVEAIFGGDRTHALGSLRHMMRDDQIELKHGARTIQVWELEAWLRLPHNAATEQSLAGIEVSITQRGLAWY